MAGQLTLSVVFPNYNDARFLPTQLESMLRQSYLPKEILIVDDASTDDSVAVIESFIAREPRIRLIRNERNLGVERNINRLIAEATADYVYLSASDDAVLPGFFEQSMTLLARYPEAGLCSALGRLMNEDGVDAGLRSLPVISRTPCYLPPEDVRRALLRYGRWFAISSMIVRRDALMAEGGQVPEVGSFADTFAALVIALRHGACFIPEALSSWREKRGSHSSKNHLDHADFAHRGEIVVGLMRTKYRELFPPEYVDQFARHWRYMVNVSAANNAAIHNERTLRSLITDGRDADWLDLLCLGVLAAVVRGFSLGWRAYAMARFGPWRWWIWGRLSILINAGELRIRETHQP